MNSFVESDILTADFYEKFVCDCSWSGDNTEFPKDKSVIFCPTEAVWRIFDLLHFHKPDRKYILVSGYSDFGIWYQQEAHPNADLGKRFALVDLRQLAGIRNHYCNVPLCGATENCRPDHKFSIKIDSLTGGTFDSIPPQILQWYCVNCNVYENGLFPIPLGMNEQGHGKDIVRTYFKTPSEKSKLLYVNFTNYTSERVYLKQYFGQWEKEDWLTLVKEGGRKIEDFYSDLADHLFVLCPFGNGLDCYRLYETWACGSIPILPNCRWSQNFKNLNLPVILVDNLFGLNYNNIKDLSERCKEALLYQTFNYETITKGYWYKLINDSREILF